MSRSPQDCGEKEDPLKRLTDRIKDQCLRRVKEGRREALAALRRRRQQPVHAAGADLRVTLIP